jgi:hypothetical protein
MTWRLIQSMTCSRVNFRLLLLIGIIQRLCSARHFSINAETEFKDEKNGSMRETRGVRPEDGVPAVISK